MKKKFDTETILRIRRTYDELREKKKNEIRNSGLDRVSTYTLCADYDCAQSTMYKIVNRQTYRSTGEPK